MIQAEILAQIQAATGRKIVDMFDWIIGTSMGGLIALCLVYGEGLGTALSCIKSFLLSSFPFSP